MDPYLTSDLKDIESAVREFCANEMELDTLHELEDRHVYPRDLYGKIGEMGIIGAGFPEDVGGSGYGAMGHVAAVTEMCRNLPGMGMALSLGYIPGFVVDVYGNAAQREKYIRPVVEGKFVSAISVTEPDSGSDLGSVKTRFEEKEDHYLANGSKVFTTNAGYADFYTVMGRDGSGLSLIIVDKDIVDRTVPGISRSMTWARKWVSIRQLPESLSSATLKYRKKISSVSAARA